MRRRRGGGAAPAEACGVWLDTAELKRGPARPLTLRAASRAAGRKQSPVLLPQPGSSTSSIPRHGSISSTSSILRQSSILSFLSPLPDEGDKENRRPSPWQGPGAALPAWPVKILPLPQLEGAQEEPPGAEQGLQGTAQAGQTPQEPLELSVEPQGQSKASPGAGGHSCCWGRNKPWGSPGGRRAQPCSTAGAGDTNPGPGAAARGVCCSPQSPGPAQPLRERGQVPEGPCRQLQGCWGSRVTAHGDRDGDSPPRARASPSPPRATPSPSRDRDRDRTTTRASPSPPRDRDRDRTTTRASPSPPRAHPSPRATPSPPRAGQPPELGSEPLFTQDSEGNRVIKHW